MVKDRRISDQLYNWSDISDKRSDKFAPPACQSYSSASINEAAFSPGFINRTLQEMWQRRLQVCQWSGTWSQILFIGKYCGWTSGDDLCAPTVRRASASISGEPNGSATAVGRDLRNQLRTFEQPGRFLRIKIWIRIQAIRLDVLICPRRVLSLPI